MNGGARESQAQPGWAWCFNSLASRDQCDQPRSARGSRMSDSSATALSDESADDDIAPLPDVSAEDDAALDDVELSEEVAELVELESLGSVPAPPGRAVSVAASEDGLVAAGRSRSSSVVVVCAKAIVPTSAAAAPIAVKGFNIVISNSLGLKWPV
ncbi:MAG: hypothetical protein IT499_20240 [Rubrivivax sp.]|nr:hypothetical protein [Rubrivivax sp.]